MEKIYINCKYRPEVIIPICAVSPNWDFLCLTDLKRQGLILETIDKVRAKIMLCEERLVFDLEKDIKRVYNVSPYEFLRKWFDISKGMMDNIYFYHLYLKREDNYDGEGIDEQN